MSFNGSGTFLINTAGQPVVSGTVISSTAFNSLTADLATGLSTAITKDGQTTVTANIPMSTYKFTGLGVGSAAADSANLSQVQSTVTKLLASVSGADTVTATASPTLAAYAAGQMFYFVAAGDNTSTVTLNIDSLGAKAVTRDGSVALAAADIKSGEVVVVVYDGTRFQVVSQLNSAGDARFANVSIASSLYVGGVSTFAGNAGFSANVSIASALSVGGVAAITGATTIGGNLTLSGGTANGVAYLNGSKVVTAGSVLTFDGTDMGVGGAVESGIKIKVFGAVKVQSAQPIYYMNSDNTNNVQIANAGATGASNGQLAFTLGGVGEGMRLTSTGLGIGTSSPSSKLQVAGAISAGNDGSAVSYYFTGGMAIRGSSAGALYIDTAVSGGTDIIFRPAVTERMRIDTSGNVGIGATPPVLGYGRQVTISQGAGTAKPSLVHQSVDTNDDRIYLTSNMAFATSGFSETYTYIKNSCAATYYVQTAGQHKWYNAPSGTAGNAISFTQAMTLDASGNLLVGTTTNSARLSVVSSSTDDNAGTLYVVNTNTTAAACVAAFVTATNSTATSNVLVKFGIDSYNLGSGQINANGSGAAAFGSFSDRRLKENITDLNSQIQNIMALRPVEFDYIESEGGGHQTGFIAQDMQEVYPDAVGDRGDGMLTVTGWSKTEARLVKAIQEQQAIIESLKSRLTALESK